MVLFDRESGQFGLALRDQLQRSDLLAERDCLFELGTSPCHFARCLQRLTECDHRAAKVLIRAVRGQIVINRLLRKTASLLHSTLRQV